MNVKIKNIIIIGLNICLLIASSWLQIPLMVPITLQLMIVFIISGLYNIKISIISLLLYILLGILGLPVFSAFTSGVAAIVGPTGGYLLSFILIPFNIFFIGKIIKESFILKISISYLISLLTCYIIGTLWYMTIMKFELSLNTILDTLLITVVPFIVADLIKLVLSIIIVKRLKKTNLYNDIQ